MISEPELLYDLKRLSTAYPTQSPEAANDAKLRSITADLIALRSQGLEAYMDPLGEPRGRQLRLERQEVADYLDEKCVVVTGAAGGVGERLLCRLVEFQPKQIVLVDKNRERLDEVFAELSTLAASSGIELVKYPCDLAEADQTDTLFSDYSADVVFHLAAERNVVTNQLEPQSALRDNIVATQNLVRAVTETGVERCVFASSRKATMYRPENVLGSTKRLAECIVRQAADEPTCPTRFAIVRFIAIVENSFCYHIFEEQIARNRAVSVTDISISHVFQNMNEAVNLLLNAGVHADRGELYGAKNIGWPIPIMDLALYMIHQSGKSLPIQISGLRAGDNGHEYGVVDPKTFQDTMMFNVLEAFDHELHGDYVQATPFEVPDNFDDLLEDVLDSEHLDHTGVIKKLDHAVSQVLRYNIEIASPDLLRRLRKILTGTKDQELWQMIQSATHHQELELV